MGLSVQRWCIALFVPLVTDRALRDFPCLPSDSGGSPTVCFCLPLLLPLLCPPAQYSAPRWPARALAGPNIAAEEKNAAWAPAARSYWQALHSPVNQPPAPGDWVAEKDCHLANCSGHAPFHHVCVHACVYGSISIEHFWNGRMLSSCSTISFLVFSCNAFFSFF